VTFSELSIHPALAAALAARGYETPTGVQAAVLEAGNSGRDLLVSSHTGSGKTVAFGAAMADSLLAAGETQVPRGPNPIALVIVPTRELAVQVREELRWLFASAHPRLASFTGGTPVMGDVKALQRGVELAIGTPGRLVDLLRRQSLKLADVRVVVLDEADEMLDLGFRQDLETLLEAAPATRRTLLLSATLPPEIRAMARRYQRDAIAIDPRKAAGADSGPGQGAHEDITHRAHLFAGGDRLAAVVNVLRAEEETTRAIVFCTTREGVVEMHAALVARGFAATAISGDRAQAERDRALEQLRRGDAQVLVATNVAARGLHLPDVVVGEHDGVRRSPCRHSGRARVAEGERPRAGLDQQAVSVAVVAALELYDQVAAGEAARQPDRAHGRLGAGGNQAHQFDRGQQAANRFRELDLGFGRRAEGKRARRSGLNRFDYCWMGMPYEHRTPGPHIIDVAAALGVPKVRARSALEKRRRAADGAESAYR